MHPVFRVLLAASCTSVRQMDRLDERAGRAWFAVQAAAGAIWWALVFTVPAIRLATLGSLPPVPVASADLPLFVVASAVAAISPVNRLASRIAVWIVAPWTLLVTLALAGYATATGQAGWGVVIMAAASAGSVASGLLVRTGRFPIERLLIGPLAFRPARRTDNRSLFVATGSQLVTFWTVFLVIVPVPVILLERRWGLRLQLSETAATALTVAGVVALVLTSVLGAWSAVTMTRIGRGTPLPSSMPNRLVIAGPYRWVRNPMAVAGVGQSIAVGLIGGSWLVVGYSLAGAVLWHLAIRPSEEADLAGRFGDDYADYHRRVSTWLPRRRRRHARHG